MENKANSVKFFAQEFYKKRFWGDEARIASSNFQIIFFNSLIIDSWQRLLSSDTNEGIIENEKSPNIVERS